MPHLGERSGALLAKWGRMAKFRSRPRSAELLFRAAHLADPRQRLAARELTKARLRRAGTLRSLNGVIIGTTGLCNASCIHCPTGKAATAASPRYPMPLDLFRRIVDDLADGGVELTGQMAFGLFGDGLLDPHVLERARYVAERLPDISLSINTNGAAYNAGRHAALAPYIDTLALHCESLDPATYDELMTPLRARNVFPKYEPILAAFPGKVTVSVPVSRLNYDQLGSMRAWFMARGARDVHFDPLSNRCADDQSAFDRLAFAPVPAACARSLMDYVVVDCDGTVLACCNDFSRREPIGHLATERLAETLASPARTAFGDMLARGAYAEASTCRTCYADRPVLPEGMLATAGA